MAGLRRGGEGKETRVSGGEHDPDGGEKRGKARGQQAWFPGKRGRAVLPTVHSPNSCRLVRASVANFSGFLTGPRPAGSTSYPNRPVRVPRCGLLNLIRRGALARVGFGEPTRAGTLPETGSANPPAARDVPRSRSGRRFLGVDHFFSNHSPRLADGTARSSQSAPLPAPENTPMTSSCPKDPRARNTLEDEPDIQQAYHRFEKERARLKKVRRVNLQTANAVIVVLGCLPAIQKLQPAIEARDWPAGVQPVGDLEDLGLGLLYADFLFRESLTRKDSEESDLKAAIEVRDRLRKTMQALIKSKVLPPCAMGKDCSWRNGYVPVADALATMTGALQRNWSAVEGRCPYTLEDVMNAERFGTFLTRIRERRWMARTAHQQIADNRNRAFTLFMDCYHQVRRAVLDLRDPHGDANKIAPNLYSVRQCKPPKHSRSGTRRGLGGSSEPATLIPGDYTSCDGRPPGAVTALHTTANASAHSSLPTCTR